MKRIITFTSLLVLLLSRQLSAAEATNQPSIFPDKKLESAARKQVFDKRETDQPIVESDVLNISTIDGKGLGITNLTGLDKCRNLASIDLAKNKIDNLKPLAGLEKVQYLN